jgi:hypothetical protein
LVLVCNALIGVLAALRVRLLPAIGSNHFLNAATSLEGFTAQSEGGYLLLNCKEKSFNLASKGHFAAIPRH